MFNGSKKKTYFIWKCKNMLLVQQVGSDTTVTIMLLELEEREQAFGGCCSP